VEEGSTYGVAVRCDGVVCRTITYRQVSYFTDIGRGVRCGGAAL